MQYDYLPIHLEPAAILPGAGPAQHTEQRRATGGSGYFYDLLANYVCQSICRVCGSGARLRGSSFRYPRARRQAALTAHRDRLKFKPATVSASPPLLLLCDIICVSLDQTMRSNLQEISVTAKLGHFI